jgi:hypothetical protein
LVIAVVIEAVSNWRQTKALLSERSRRLRQFELARQEEK